MKELNYMQKAIARDVGVGMPDDKLLKKWGKHLTKPKLRRWKKDPKFNEESEKISKLCEEKLAQSKAKLTIMVAELALDIVEGVLTAQPYNPETGEGDKHYDHGEQVDVSIKLIKELGLGKNDAAKDAGITLIFERGQTKKDKAEVKRERKEFHLDLDDDNEEM